MTTTRMKRRDNYTPTTGRTWNDKKRSKNWLTNRNDWKKNRNATARKKRRLPKRKTLYSNCKLLVLMLYLLVHLQNNTTFRFSSLVYDLLALVWFWGRNSDQKRKIRKGRDWWLANKNIILFCVYNSFLLAVWFSIYTHAQLREP